MSIFILLISNPVSTHIKGKCVKNGIIWMKNRQRLTHTFVILAIRLPFFMYPAECENTCDFFKNSMISIRRIF